tara:strand:- start:768 stop:1043 length:276 start_codon:yes stop_codon:yes gene_type:complete
MKLDHNIYLVEKNKMMNGIQYKYLFPNGLGASLIRHEGSYGYDKGLWEIAPLGKDGEFIGQSVFEWYDDVKGHLTAKESKSILLTIYNHNP